MDKKLAFIVFFKYYNMTDYVRRENMVMAVNTKKSITIVSALLLANVFCGYALAAENKKENLDVLFFFMYLNLSQSVMG